MLLRIVVAYERHIYGNSSMDGGGKIRRINNDAQEPPLKHNSLFTTKRLKKIKATNIRKRKKK